jgi:CHAD domain-containing protein
LDVTIDLIQKRIHAANDDAARDAWREVQQDLENKRNRELLRARRQISQCDVMAFIKQARSLLESGDQETDPERSLKKSVERGLIEWSDALDQAMQDQAQNSFHAFRIAGKRLRYAVELLAAMGESSSKSKVNVLKKLQDQIGDWHDRQVLLQLVADFISRADFLAAHPDLARTLLAEMDSEHQRDDAAVASILESAERIRTAWTAENDKRRATEGNGADAPAAELPASRMARS